MAHATTLSASELRALYGEHGYLVVPELLSSSELAELRAGLTVVLERVAGLTESSGDFSVVRTDDGDRPCVRRILNPIAHHKAFFDLVFKPKIIDLVENLIGPNIQLHHTSLNLKPPTQQASFEWHQDYPYFPHTNFDLLAAMIFLDDATPENGCLTLIPGSHTWGPLSHGPGLTRIEDPRVLENRSAWLDVPVPAGGLELHHCNMVHKSGANTTDCPRSAIVIWYRAADNVEVGRQRSYPGLGLQVRGVNPGVVRMIDLVFPFTAQITSPTFRVPD